MNASLAQQPISFLRLSVYGLVSIFLTMSLFMSIFAPMPLIMGVISSGKKFGYLAIGISFFLVSIFSLFIAKEIALFALFAYICFVAVVVYESIERGWKPSRTLVISGVSSFILLFGVWSFSGLSSKTYWISNIESISKELEKNKDLILSEDKQGIEILSLLSRPEELATRIQYEFPGALFLALHFILWLSLLITLRVGRVLLKGFSFSEAELLKFKVKDSVIWVSLGAFALMIFGEDLGDIRYAYVGRSLGLIFGTYYFFQGFGILSQFLDKFKVFGFFRSFLVVSIVAFAWWLLAVLGIADFWIQFDKFLNNKGATS